MTLYPILKTSALAFAASLLVACGQAPSTEHLNDLTQRIENRHFPSAFMAWNPIDMPARYPLNTLQQRLKAAAKHDLLWEEPISQLSFGTELVLGLEWDHRHAGLATKFKADSLSQALTNRSQLLKLNPNLVMLMEVRWRDAPDSYLPSDSPFWLRNEDGSRVAGWDGGPEPYYKLNYENPQFLKRVGEMSRLAVESGVYDGIMLDWSGNLGVVKAVRAAIGEQALINVNLHDNIDDAAPFKKYINGSFMECNPGHSRLCGWDDMAKALDFFETQFREPQINGVEVWGKREDEQRMRAATALALTKSDGYVLYGDSNKLKTPDHLHDWYPYWDLDLGKPAGAAESLGGGSFLRHYDNAVVVFSSEGDKPIKVRFDEPHVRASDGIRATEFELQPVDGDLYFPLSKLQ